MKGSHNREKEKAGWRDVKNSDLVQGIFLLYHC
jgi:hypothetical protein